MLIPLENAVSLAYLNAAGYSLGIDPCLLQQTRNFRRVRVKTDIDLYAVYAYVGKVDVRLDPHAADRCKYPLLDCGSEIHFVRDILE